MKVITLKEPAVIDGVLCRARQVVQVPDSYALSDGDKLNTFVPDEQLRQRKQAMIAAAKRQKERPTPPKHVKAK